MNGARNLLFITRKWRPAIGGMETYCERLVEALSRNRTVDVIALPGRLDGRPPAALALIFFPFTILLRWLRISPRPGIVHLGDLAIWPAGLLAFVLAPGASLVLSAHGTDISYAFRRTLRGGLYLGYLRLGARLLASSQVIANSGATADACSKVGWGNVGVVPLGTDLQPIKVNELRPDTILFAGRLIRQKGLSWFVANVLPQLREGMRLEVAGLPVDPSEIAALDHPRVDFLGPLTQSELCARYAKAACVVVPNVDLGDGSFEGFGLVAPEAAAAGGVVIAAATGGLTSAVRDGETGFLVPSGDVQVWVDQIRIVLEWDPEKRDRFVQSSISRAREYFSWERVAKETEMLYLSAQQPQVSR